MRYKPSKRTAAVVAHVFLLLCGVVTATVRKEKAPTTLNILFGMNLTGFSANVMRTILPFLEERFDSVTVNCLWTPQYSTQKKTFSFARKLVAPA